MRPIKGQKLQAMLAGESVGSELEQYIRERAAKRLLIVNIESVPALDALDKILQVPDLDGVLIGPHDLSCSLEVPEQYEHPSFLDACETIFRKARAASVGAGIHFWGDVQKQTLLLKLGANMLIHSGDISLFQKHLQLEMAAIKTANGLAGEDTASSAAVIRSSP